MKKLISGMLIFLLLMVSNLSVFAEYNGTSNYISNYHTLRNVIVTDEGVYINGKYYTKEEFKDALQYSYEIKPRFAPALAAGTYYIPFIGEVVVAAGQIFLAGVAIVEGSWLFNEIVNYFSRTSSIESDYNSAKNECRPSNNHKKTNKYHNTPSRGEAYSTLDIYKDGILQTRRYFGSNGRAEFDIDFSHGDSNNNHVFPHCHEWPNGQRSKDPYPCCK